MSDPRHIFRSAAPSVLAVWRQLRTDEDDWCKRRDEVLTKLDPTGKRRAVMTTGWGSRRFIGLSHEHGNPIPDGWRKHPKSWDIIVPLRSKKEGKVAARLIDNVQPPPRPKFPGMPSDHFSGLSFLSPGIQLHADHLYALWAGDEPPPDIDADLWEPVKRSEWYALLESEEVST